MAFSCQAVTILAVASANADSSGLDFSTRRDEKISRWSKIPTEADTQSELCYMIYVDHYLQNNLWKACAWLELELVKNPVSSLTPEDNFLVNSAFSFGKNLGVAFQLVDDWLDFTQDAELLGKPAAADLRYTTQLERPLLSKVFCLAELIR